MKRFYATSLIILYPLLNIWAGGSPDGENLMVERYNQALQLYGEGKFGESLQLLEKLQFGKDGDEIDKLLLQSASQFRMGESLAEREGDLIGALIDIDSSIGLLQRVLELDGENSTAANNIEVLLNYRQKLQEQQEQQKRSSQSDSSPQDQAKELQHQQEQMAEDQNKQSDQHKESQKGLREETEQLMDKTEQGSPEREDLEKAVQSQYEAEKALEEGENDKAEEKQREASRNLQNAVDKMSRKEEDGQTAPPEDSGENDREQVLQSILDNENNHKEKSDTTGSGITVERNW